MPLELFCCDACGKVSQDAKAEHWKEFRVGRFVFSILVHSVCPPCQRANATTNHIFFSAIVGTLQRQYAGKNEGLVDRFTLIRCETDTGGCGQYWVQHDGEIVGSGYDIKPHVDAVSVTETVGLCPNCTPIRPEKKKKNRHKKKKKHKKNMARRN